MPRNRHPEVDEMVYDSVSEDEACASPSPSTLRHQNGLSGSSSSSHGHGHGGKTRSSKLKASMTKLRESSREVREKLGKVHLPHVHLPSLHLSKRLHHKEPAGGPHETEKRRRGGRKRGKQLKLLKAGRGSNDLNDWGMTHEEELESVEQFKGEILSRGEEEDFDIKKEHLEDENKLLRFLKARNFDLDKATEMFVKHLRWREENDVDEILFQTFPEREQLLKFYPQGYHMCDKQGRPVYIQYLGGINVHKILAFTDEETVYRVFIQEYEKFLHFKLPACSEAQGRYIDTSLNIMDVKGISLKLITKESQRMMKKLTSITQDNYPETMGNMIIINAPYIFKMIYGLVKPMLSPRTQSKIIVLGSRYMDKLLEFVDIDCLPKKIGGTSKYSIFDDIGPWSDLVPSITTAEQLSLYQSQQTSKWTDRGGAITKSKSDAQLSDLNGYEYEEQQIYSDEDVQEDSGAFYTTRWSNERMPSVSEDILLDSSTDMSGVDADVSGTVDKPSLLDWVGMLEQELAQLVIRGETESRRDLRTRGTAVDDDSTSIMSRIKDMEMQLSTLLDAYPLVKEEANGKESQLHPPPRFQLPNQPTWVQARKVNQHQKGVNLVDRIVELEADICALGKQSPALFKAGAQAVKESQTATHSFTWFGIPHAFTCCYGGQAVPHI